MHPLFLWAVLQAFPNTVAAVLVVETFLLGVVFAFPAFVPVVSVVVFVVPSTDLSWLVPVLHAASLELSGIE